MRKFLVAAGAAAALALGVGLAPAAQATITTKSTTTDWSCTFNTIRTTWTYQHDTSGPRNKVLRVRIQVLFGPYITHEEVYVQSYRVINWTSALTNDITLSVGSPVWYTGTGRGLVITTSSGGRCSTNTTYMN